MSRAISITRVSSAPPVNKVLLSTALEPHPEILVAYLYGSVAEGVAHQRSDVDVAVLLEDSFNLKQSLEYRMELAEELSHLLGREVDLVILNEATPLLQFQVIRHRQILLERDPEERALFEMRVMSRFYEYKRFFDFHARQLRKALRRGEQGVREKGH